MATNKNATEAAAFWNFLETAQHTLVIRVGIYQPTSRVAHVGYIGPKTNAAACRGLSLLLLVGQCVKFFILHAVVSDH